MAKKRTPTSKTRSSDASSQAAAPEEDDATPQAEVAPVADRAGPARPAEPIDACAPPVAAAASPSRLEKLDRDIVALMNQRAALSGMPGAPFENAGPSCRTDWVSQIEGVVASSAGPLSADAVRAILREFYSGVRATCARRRVAYLGPAETYSHQAAIAYFGHSVDFAPVGSIAAVFEEVERGQADFGVVPIENSTDGRVADALQCLTHSRLQMCGEAPLRIRHCLLGLGPRSGVRRVCSKPQALSQCRHWISKHLPAVELVETASTAAAAEMACRDAATAAIASETAAAIHSLQVLARHIEDNPHNVTRFAILGAASASKSGNDKTALVFETPHQPGALADAMSIFKRNRLNLTWIESFPSSQERGRYLFFVEFQGHASDLRARRAVASLRKKTLRLTVLGSYAHADPIG